jgi:AhpD family alkylhydroperoxidase
LENDSSLFEMLGARMGLARSLAAHVRELNDGGSVPRRTKELIALMVAWLTACDRCTCAHEEIARRIGIDTQTLATLGDFERSPHFSDGERAALATTVALTREPRALPGPLRARLEANYDQGERVEILAAIGLNALVGES